MCWQPILNGQFGEHARETLARIALRLRAADSTALQHPDLAGGRAGVALLFAYLSEAADRGEDSATAVRLLEEAIRALAHTPMHPMLHGGYAGVAWVVEHVAGDEGEADPNLAVDRALVGLEDDTWQRHYDLVNGLSGLLVYAVERLPRSSARTCIDRFVHRLEALSVEKETGRTWHAVPAEGPAPAPRTTSDTRYLFGVAHGVAGVVGSLAAVCRAVDHAPARRLLEAAVSWLLAQRCPEGAEAAFPFEVDGDRVGISARQGWCVGDPGVAATLLSAARALGRVDWEQCAVEAAVAAAQRHASAGVKEAGLCHGAAGLGHLYNRMYQATGEPALEQAARHWLHAACELYRPQSEAPGFLLGEAGIGLALLAGVSDVEPLWDRTLAIAIPPRA